jgi:hypothetical protein
MSDLGFLAAAQQFEREVARVLTAAEGEWQSWTSTGPLWISVGFTAMTWRRRVGC